MKTLKKLLLIFSIFLITFFGEIAVNIACGGEIDPYDYYISYFHNNVQGDEYTAFAFNRMAYLNSEENAESEPNVNSQEWAKYLSVKDEDVFKAMYQIDSATSTKLELYNGKISSLPDSLQDNSFIIGLSKHKKALKYYTFAKKCEPFANANFDLWNPQPRDTLGMVLLAGEGVKLAKSEKDKFLKLRYAYQAERMFHYANLHAESRDIYEKFIVNTESNSAVKGWALALYAGSIRRLGNPEESAFLFSKVFASNPERRVQAYKNYYYNSAPAGSALKYAKTDEEKANIWAITGFGNPEFDIQSLNNVYRYSPESKLNGVLLVREVNKLEQDLIGWSDIDKSPYNYYFSDHDALRNDSLKKVSLHRLSEIRDFALKLASEKKYGQPELGTLTAAYLSWIENKDVLAADYLSRLNADKLPEKLRNQYRITDLLIRANNIKKGNPFNENELLPTLKWLDEKRFEENKTQKKRQYYYEWAGNGENRFTLTTRNLYQQILAPAYLKMGDTAKAALAMVKGDLKYKTLTEKSLFKNITYNTISFWQQYLSPKSMERLTNYKTKADGNDVNALLAKALNQLDNDDFYELYGTAYLRTHQYDKAVKMFAKLSPDYKYFNPENWYGDNATQQLYGIPFVETINDYPKKLVPAKASITKNTFAVEMLRLQKLIISDKKNAALYYYKMANAVYQTGYYGNSWFLISYDWSSYDYSSPAKYGYDVDYKEAETARLWYLKARKLSTDPNFKAKCTFMLAKCAQKQIIMSTKFDSYSYWDKSDLNYKNFISANYNNPYFKELKLNYSKTPFYQIAAGECSYLRDFINR